MIHKQRNTNAEQSTEKHEVSAIGSEMVHLPSYGRGSTAANSRNVFQTQRETNDYHVGKNYSHPIGSIERSAFMPVKCKADINMLSSGLSSGSFKVSQKRKLDSMNSGPELDLNCSEEKRFKSDEKQGIHKGNGLLDKLNEVNQGFYYREISERPIYYGPSFTQKEYSSLRDGAPRGAARNYDSNDLSAFTNDVSKYFAVSVGVNCKGAPSRHVQEEMKTSKSQTYHGNFARTDFGVGEAESTRHGASPSKNTHEKACVVKQRNERAEKFARNSEKFISLDSTKSSFLSLIKKMREVPENQVIQCPFCNQTFYKYPELKTHVHTHKKTDISRYGNGIRTDQQSSDLDQSPALTSGNSKITPVSSPGTMPNRHSPRPPSRRISDASARAKSVIQFAEKNN